MFRDLSVKEFLAEKESLGRSRLDLARELHAVESLGNARETYWSLLSYEEHLGTEDRIFYSEESGVLLSFIFYHWILSDLEVTHWAVRRKGQGQGLKVLSQFLSHTGNKAYRVTLECGEWNARALRLYQALAFSKIAFRPHYYRSGEGAWLLERKGS